MINKLPKKYHSIVHDFYYDEDAYWLILKDGYIDPDMGTRTIHEDTIQGIKRVLKTVERD